MFIRNMKMRAIWLHVILTVFISATNLISATNDLNNSIVKAQLAIGYRIYDFDEINSQMSEYHGIGSTDGLPVIGLKGVYINNRMVFGASTLYGNRNLEKKGFDSLNSNAKIGYTSFNLNAIVGIRPVLDEKNILYPYIGLAAERFEISTNINYGIRTIDCFFQYDNKYSVFGFGFMYGFEYSRVFDFISGENYQLAIGVNAGRFDALTDDNWKVNGEKIPNDDSGMDIPKFDIDGYFLKFYIEILFTM